VGSGLPADNKAREPFLFVGLSERSQNAEQDRLGFRQDIYDADHVGASARSAEKGYRYPDSKQWFVGADHRIGFLTPPRRMFLSGHVNNTSILPSIGRHQG
jgi:hypothetical protein